MKKIKVIDINSERGWGEWTAGLFIMVMFFVGLMTTGEGLYHWGVAAYRSLGH